MAAAASLKNSQGLHSGCFAPSLSEAIYGGAVLCSSRKMEYIFQFVVEEEDEAQTLVSLEEHYLTDTDIYVDQYQYLYL